MPNTLVCTVLDVFRVRNKILTGFRVEYIGSRWSRLSGRARTGKREKVWAGLIFFNSARLRRTLIICPREIRNVKSARGSESSVNARLGGPNEPDAKWQHFTGRENGRPQKQNGARHSRTPNLFQCF